MIEYTVKVEPNGDKFWRLKGKLHCEHGPAVEWADGSKYWYLNDEELTEAEFNNRMIKSCIGKLVKVEGVKYKLVEV
jgi:hypothetical protein